MRKELIVLLVALAVTMGFSGAVSAQPMYTKQMNPQVTVPIYGGTYHPAVRMVKRGTTVGWVNRASDPHTVTSVSRLFNSGIIRSGGHYTHTFTRAGIYRYYCMLHPTTMRGILVVR